MSILSRKLMGTGAGFDPWYLFQTSNFNTSANTFDYNVYSPTRGLVHSSTVSLPTRTVAAYYQSQVSWDGTTFLVASTSSTGSGTNDRYVHIFDLTGGPTTDIQQDSEWYSSGSYFLNFISVSPRGDRFAVGNGNGFSPYLDVYDRSSFVRQFSVPSSSFGPRGPAFCSPNGTFIGRAASDESHSVIESGNRYIHSWNGWNFTVGFSNHSGLKNFYFGSAINTNLVPHIYTANYNSTGVTVVNSSTSNLLYPVGHMPFNPLAGQNALNYISGFKLSPSDYKTSQGAAVLNVDTGSIVYNNASYSSARFLPDGRVLATGSPSVILDPENSFADVTSEYHPDFIANPSGYFWYVDPYENITSTY